MVDDDNLCDIFLFDDLSIVAKDASDIVILDDNFSSIVKAVTWGRSVFDNIRKFLQFQLTVNLVALSLTFFSALSGQNPPLNAVMMLWVNLIMDTMGALALGTEPPSPTLLLRKPYKRNASLISNVMIRNILIQYLFQIVLLIYLFYYAVDDFQLGSIATTKSSASSISKLFASFTSTASSAIKALPTKDNKSASFFSSSFMSWTSSSSAAKTIPTIAESPLVSLQKNTIIFNTFVFCQLFNELNSRSISNEMNIFQNLHKNQIFLLIILVTILVQVIIVELGSDFVRTTSLSVSQWIKCILLGSLSLPLGGLMRLIPVQDSDTDFAVLPSILVQKSHEAKMKLMENKNFLTEEQKSEYRR
jgi:magnesium-transporting ATPase (P-type)